MPRDAGRAPGSGVWRVDPREPSTLSSGDETVRLPTDPRRVTRKATDLRNAGDLQEARDLLRKALEKWPGNIYFWNVLLSCRVNDPARAEMVLGEMEQRGVHPDRATFGTLLNAYANDTDPDGGEDVMRRMREAGIEPGVTTFTTLMKAYVRAEDPTGAREVLDRMRAEKRRPDVTAFTTLVNAYARVGRPEDAERILVRMEKAGIAPNAKTFTTLIDAYANAGEPEGAEWALERMRARGMEPTMVSFNAVIKACARATLPGEGERILEEMRRAGIRPNFAGFKTLMTAYLTEDDLEGAKRLLEKAAGEGSDLTAPELDFLADRYRHKKRCRDLEERLREPRPDSRRVAGMISFLRHVAASVKSIAAGLFSAGSA